MLCRAICLLVLVLTLAACRPPPDGAGAAARLPPGVTVEIALGAEPRVATVPVTVTITRDGTPLAGATVTVTGDMTHAGMIPVVAATTEVMPGHYRADTFAFDMVGDWFITAEVRLPTGERAVAVKTVRVERAAP
jgi:hypothetical protein